MQKWYEVIKYDHLLYQNSLKMRYYLFFQHLFLLLLFDKLLIGDLIGLLIRLENFVQSFVLLVEIVKLPIHASMKDRRKKIIDYLLVE